VGAWGARWGGQTSHDGVVTHGGSLANLTAMLTARAARFPGYFRAGPAAATRGRPAVLVGADAHYSISRSAAIAGFGTEQVIRLPQDERRRVRPEAIEPALERARAAGLDPFCIIGSACSTPIGAFDPLEMMGEIAARHGLWFHVDGAHGASLLFSRRHRGLLRGIERADSVTWDAHKMMFVPALCTFLLLRDGRAGYETFNQDAPYLFDPDAQPTRDFDAALRTVECTRRSLAIPVYALWAAFGPGLFEDLVDLVIGRVRELHEMVSAAEDFEALHEPECNILCLRHVPARRRGRPEAEISAFQLEIRRRLMQEGGFYITTTKLDGAACLRVVLMNPRVERAHLEELLQRVRRLAAEDRR
jgi:L-2,4-diaminobutyrate decarboxylase